MIPVNYLKEYLYPIHAVLNLTDDCNLACKYCFVQQQPHYMTYDMAKDIVDYLINNYKIREKENLLNGQNKIGITFFGGEPTLLFDTVIKPIILYIKNGQYAESFDFNMTTNGTLLNEERIKFLKENDVGLLLSIDGDKETQNYNRPCKNLTSTTSFDLLNKNIPILLKYYPNLIFRSTIYKDTVNHLYDNFLFAEKMGFKHFIAIPDARSKNWDDESQLILKQEIDKICLHQLNNFLQDTQNFITYTNLQKAISSIVTIDMMNIQNLWFGEPNPNRCGLGTTGISINYKGDIFTCQEQDSRATGDFFYIGNIFNGIDQTLHEKIISKYINASVICEKPSYCNECYFNRNCNRGCPSTGYDLFGNFGTKSFITCYYEKLLGDNAILIMKILMESQNQPFKKIIDSYINKNIFQQKDKINKKEG